MLQTDLLEQKLVDLIFIAQSALSNKKILLPASLIALPASVILGEYVGQGAGYLLGNMVDSVPYLEGIAPDIARDTGLLSGESDNFNEDFFQTSLGLAGKVAGPVALIKAYQFIKQY